MMLPILIIVFIVLVIMGILSGVDVYLDAARLKRYRRDIENSIFLGMYGPRDVFDLDDAQRYTKPKSPFDDVYTLT